MDRIQQIKHEREQAEKRAAQIDAEFIYWAGIVISGFLAAIILAGYIVFKGGK